MGDISLVSGSSNSSLDFIRFVDSTVSDHRPFKEFVTRRKKMTIMDQEIYQIGFGIWRYLTLSSVMATNKFNYISIRLPNSELCVCRTI